HRLETMDRTCWHRDDIAGHDVVAGIGETQSRASGQYLHEFVASVEMRPEAPALARAGDGFDRAGRGRSDRERGAGDRSLHGWLAGGAANRFGQRHRLAGRWIDPHHHHLALAVHGIGIVGLDDAMRQRYRTVAQARAAQFDAQRSGPFDGAQVLQVAGGQHRCRVVGDADGQALQPLQAGFLQIGEVDRIVHVVERVHVAPAHVDGGNEQRLIGGPGPGPLGRLRMHQDFFLPRIGLYLSAEAMCLVAALTRLAVPGFLGLTDFRCGARKWPVCDAGVPATVSGVPATRMRPPPAPPSGPRSTTQSAVLITSRLCSITTTVLPWSTSWCSTSSSCSMSWKCRPVVGSSRMYRVRPVSRLDSSLDSLTRCASPPDSVVALWPSLM